VVSTLGAPSRAALNLAPARVAIFDMDGLLVDSEPFWRAAHTEVLGALGVDVAGLVASGMTRGMRVDEVVAMWRAHQPWQGPGDDEVAERIVAAVADGIRRHAVLLPGAIGSLEFFQRHGLVLALATGSTVPVVDAVLDRFGLRSRFAVVSSAEQDTHGKPHPAIFLRTAELVGEPASACVVLEDAINGVIAAKAARMRAIAVPPAELAADPRYSIADVVLASLEEIDSPLVAALLGLAAAEAG
jgi:sugar-phosphatase